MPRSERQTEILQWEWGWQFRVTGHTGLSGIGASSCDRDLPSTSPTECWPLFQVPGTQERRVSSLGELVSSWGEETYVNTVHPRMQGKEIGGGAGGREVIREGLVVGEGILCDFHGEQQVRWP